MDIMDATEFGSRRTVPRFAWLPVHVTGERWLSRAAWLHLVWYEATEAWEPDYGGVSTGNWVVTRVRPLHEAATHA